MYPQKAKGIGNSNPSYWDEFLFPAFLKHFVQSTQLIKLKLILSAGRIETDVDTWLERIEESWQREPAGICTWQGVIHVSGDPCCVLEIRAQTEACDIIFTPGCKLIDPAKPAGSLSHSGDSFVSNMCSGFYH